MNKLCMISMFFLAFFVASCASSDDEEVKREYFANEESMIMLQHPKTRILIRCYSNEYQPAEECAKTYEKAGYIRTKDIPAKPAEYDLKKHKHYPTRRWREGETTPRW